VVFDKTKDKFDDSEFKGVELDPLGTIKGGETYVVRYADGQFSCTGYNQYYARVGTWTYSNGSPFDSELSLWGGIFVFDGKGNVYFEEYGLVGHLEKQTSWQVLFNHRDEILFRQREPDAQGFWGVRARP
jgi:hypothetical protein